MGTRGILGFVIDGEEKLAYNHFDSYPSGLGSDVLKWLREQNPTTLQEVRDKARALRCVGDETPPRPEDVAALEQWGDPSVGGPINNREIRSWYQLLRRTQGDPEAILQAGAIEHAPEFALDSLFCEWGYVVDLDRDVLEVYRGFQHGPHEDGRFAARRLENLPENGYWPIRLVAEYPLSALPDDKTLCSLEDNDSDEDD